MATQPPKHDDQQAAGHGGQRPLRLTRRLEGRHQRVDRDERIGEADDREVTGGRGKDCRIAAEQAHPDVGCGDRQHADRGHDAGRKPHRGPGDARGPRELARPDVAADHGEHRRTQAEVQRIEQVFQPHRRTESGERSDAKQAGVGRERCQSHVVQHRRQRHRRADAQDLAEQAALEADAAQRQGDRRAARGEIPGKRRGRSGEGDHRGKTGAGDAERGDRAQAEDERRHQRDMQDLGADIDVGEDGDLSGCPHHARERAEQPVGERAGEDHVGIFEGGREDRSAAAQQTVDARPGEQEHGAEQRRGARGDRQRMDDERCRVLAPPGADRPRDRGGDGAAHGHVGHLLHQHHQREHQGQSGQGIEAEMADEMRIDAGRHRDQHDIDHEIGHREPQQGGNDRAFQHQARARCSRRSGFRGGVGHGAPQSILGGQLCVSPTRWRHHV